MNKNQESAAGKQLFRQYVAYITEKVLEKNTIPYSNPNIMRSSWRNIIPYSTEMDKFIIFESRNFLHIFPKSHNLRFLKELVIGLSDYISAYFQKNPSIANRNAARKYARKMMYEENPYIQYLKSREKAANDSRQSKQNQPEAHQSQRNKRQRINGPINEFNTAQTRIQIINSKSFSHKR